MDGDPGDKNWPAYAAVTPARNEAENLVRLFDCLRTQACVPAVWVIVDDGSVDDSRSWAEAKAVEHSWIRVISSPGVTSRAGEIVDGRRQGRDVIAFVAGVSSVPPSVDVVVKLDADVSFDPDFFSELIARFAADERLGIASGSCYEWERGEWRQRHVTADHVWGATRAYRTACLETIGPLHTQLGWDGIDEFQAHTAGWRTRTFTELPFRHHRPEGQREGSSYRHWHARGVAAHYLGYRFWYLLVRALRHGFREPVAIGMVVGFATSLLRRAPQSPDGDARTLLREEQALRRLPTRIRESLGR